MIIMAQMTSDEKKKHIKKLIGQGDKRSYNELQADIELQIWNEQHGGTSYSTSDMKPISERRNEAKKRLEAQLKSGMKPNKFGTTKEKKAKHHIPLTDKDRERIERGIDRLEKKIYGLV